MNYIYYILLSILALHSAAQEFNCGARADPSDLVQTGNILII